MISLEVSFTMKSLVDLQETTLNHEVSKYMIGSAHQMEFFIYLYDIYCVDSMVMDIRCVL